MIIATSLLRLFFEKIFVFSKNLQWYSANVQIKIVIVKSQMKSKTLPDLQNLF